MNIKKTFSKIVGVALCAVIAIPSFSVSAVESTNRIDEIMSRMTLQDKIAQMIMPSFRSWKDKNGESQPVTVLNDTINGLLKKYPFSGIALFAENCRNTSDCADLLYEMQRANAVNSDRSQLIIATDQEGGTVVRLGQGCNFCGNMALAATGDPQYTEQAAEIIGSELSAVGINADFAPVADVNNEPSNPVIGVRSFSDDKNTVSELVSRYIKGLKKNDIITTAKHFPGHGNTGTDSHTGLPMIESDYSELKKNELVPFARAISDGTDMIMTAHIQYPNIEKDTYVSKETGEEIYLPATLSKKMLTDILRKDMGFEGVVITDAMNMDAIAKHFDKLDAAKLAINAGVDIILWPVYVDSNEGAADFEDYIASLVKMAESGDISTENIDKSVKRILTLKGNHDLLNKYSVKNISVKAYHASITVGSAQNHEKEFDITKKSITLLKNDGNTLPIKADGHKTAILTAYDDELISAQYAVDLLKDSGRIAKDTEIVVDTYRYKTPEEAAALTEGADNVVLITEMYNKNYIDPTTEAGKTFDNVKKIISAVHEKKGKVTVISCYLPYDTAYFQDADAILTAWTMKGMSEDPRFKDQGITAYGPSIPAGVFMAFENGEDTSGILPINIPEIDSEYNFSSKYIYERGFGLTYNDTMVWGDSDKDSKVTVRDCALVARMLANSNGDLLPWCADHNKDGKINVRDAASIAKELAGKANESPISEHIDYMALVNKLNPLPDGWEEALETVTIKNSLGDDVEVEKKAYAAYLELKAELEKDNVYVDLDSARRSVAAQQRIMDEFTEKYGADYAAKTVAAPGFSEHHTGLALDLYLNINGKDVYLNEDMVQYPDIWAKIHDKLAKHGFILRYLEDKEHITGYGYEPWHIRYIDNADIAKKIMSKGITFEEYLGAVNSSDVTVDYGKSKTFTEDELKEAAVQIKCKFASFKGCELHSIRYAGDESNNKENLKRMNLMDEGKGYTQVIEFLTDFHTPSEGSDVFAADKEMKDYQWWLARTDDSGWQLLSWGY